MAEFLAGSVYRHFPRLRLVVCSVLFSYIRGSKTGYSVQSQLTNLIKEECTDSAWEHQILKGPINFSSLPLVMGIAMSLWWEKLLRAFVSGKSGVRSGNSIDLHVFGYKTQCCTQFKSPGDKILCVLYLHFNVAFTFKWYGNSWNKTVYSQRVWIGYSIELAE